MLRLRFVLVAFALFAAACGSSIDGADGSLSVDGQVLVVEDSDSLSTSQTNVDPIENSDESEVDDDDSLPSEAEDLSGQVLADRDDISVRVVESTPVVAGGSSVLSAEVFAVLDGPHGDGDVSLPALNVTATPGILFTSVPDGCVTTDVGVDCIVDTLVVISGPGSTSETNALLLEFEYSVAVDAELPVVFELEASSFNNSAEDDPVPSNNTITVEVETAG